MSSTVETQCRGLKHGCTFDQTGLDILSSEIAHLNIFVFNQMSSTCTVCLKNQIDTYLVNLTE